MEDEDLMFDAIDPSFFNMSNPTLADLSIDNNNVGPTALSQAQQTQHIRLSNTNLANLTSNNNNIRSHQNHHGLGIFNRGQSSNFNDLFSNPPSQQNFHGLGILQRRHTSNQHFSPTLSQQNQHGLGILQHGQGSNNGNDPFNSNVMPQQSQHGIGNNDPFSYNLVTPENDNAIQQGNGGNNDPFIYNLVSSESDQDIQQEHDDDNDSFANAMSQQNQHDVQQQHGQGSNDETFSVPMVQDQYDHQNNNNNNFSSGGNNFEVGGSSSRIMHENQQQTQPAIQIPVLLNQTETQTLNQWPPTEVPYFCSCCHVLREIIHANGIQFEKLEIHGRLGLITHAIHHQIPVNGAPSMYQMIDFGGKSLGEIKKLLAQYCVERNLAGYFLLQDPMSEFYETLCTGLDWIDDINMEGPIQNNSDEVVEQEHEQEQMGENGAPRNLSEQRKKSAKLTLSDLCDYFHLPIEEAADHENLKLCPTVLKKTCRKAGLTRWPHRKVKSLLKQIALLLSQLDIQDPGARARTEGEINRLKDEMVEHCGGHVPTALYNVAAFLPPQQQR